MSREQWSHFPGPIRFVALNGGCELKPIDQEIIDFKISRSWKYFFQMRLFLSYSRQLTFSKIAYNYSTIR